MFSSWKTWERGAPELAVEFISKHDPKMFAWHDKLVRYRELGVRELVCFDGDLSQKILRVWDRVDDDLVERVIENDTTPCVTLGLHWVVRDAEMGLALRLAHAPDGGGMLPTPAEAERLGREAAERRIAELEAELRKR